MSQNGTDALTRVFDLIKTLRGEGGCPWDRAQSLDEVLSDLVEEAYELQWACTRGSGSEVFDEMGDVLFLLCFAMAIKQETSADFDLARIASHAHDKIKSRHPHVFGSDKAETPEESIVYWEKVKADERASKNIGGRFEGVASNLPPVRLAEKIQERAAAVGFDWDEPSGIIAKLREEIEEVETSLKNQSPDAVREELGDLLFSVINLTRFLKVDASSALKSSTSKFIRRFEEMERRIHADHKNMREMSLEEMDVYWEKAKNE